MIYKKKCQTCAKYFLRQLSPSNIKNGKGKYCSRVCCVVDFIRLRNEKLISLNINGLELGRKKGKIFTKEHKKKISESLAGKYGSFSRNWKGGIEKINNLIRRRLVIKRWRDEVLIRDNYKCQICGDSKNTLNVHHIKKFADYPELRTNVENGITLCENCHLIVNWHEKEWETLFISTLKKKGIE